MPYCSARYASRFELAAALIRCSGPEGPAVRHPLLCCSFDVKLVTNFFESTVSRCFARSGSGLLGLFVDFLLKHAKPIHNRFE